MLNDALNQSIKSENIITSQFDVIAETTVNDRASNLCFSTGKNPDCEVVFLAKNVSFESAFLCQCLKRKKEVDGSLRAISKIQK